MMFETGLDYEVYEAEYAAMMVLLTDEPEAVSISSDDDQRGPEFDGDPWGM